MSAPAPITVSAPQKVGAATLTSVTSGGTTGSTHYGYKIVGLDSAGNHTAASAEVVATDGNATLSNTNNEALAWTDPAHCTSVAIYRTTGGATQGLIGTVAAGVQAFTDTGLVADGSTPPATDTTGIGVQTTTTAAWDPVFYLDGTFTGTYQPQVSYDGTNWLSVGSALAAPGWVNLPGSSVAFRLKCTAYTSGTPTAKLLYFRR